MLNPVPTSYIYLPPTEPYLSVVYADDDILVVDKPSGLLSVPGKDPALRGPTRSEPPASIQPIDPPPAPML